MLSSIVIAVVMFASIISVTLEHKDPISQTIKYQEHKAEIDAFDPNADPDTVSIFDRDSTEDEEGF